MKRIILLSFLVISIFAKAQSYKVIYKLKLTENYKTESSNKLMDERKKNLYKSVFEIAADFIHTLVFNQNESLYTFDEPMKPDDVDDMAFFMARLAGGKDTVYQNKLSKIILYRVKFNEKNVLEKYQLNNDWKITNQRKKILGYNVIKAIKGRNIAWFTPDIPVPFGPNGQGGLPGLILEYSFGPRTIYASKIIKMNKKLDIVKPKGEIIEHEILKNKRMEQMTRHRLKNKR